MTEAASSLLKRWTEWVTFVVHKGPWPTYLPSTLKIWIWLLERYSDVPHIRTVALQWWLEKTLRYNEQRYMLELGLTTVNPETAAVKTNEEIALLVLSKVVEAYAMKSKSVIGYAVFNPETSATEYVCKLTADSKPFGPCSSKIAEIVARQVGIVPVPYPAQTGPIFGFLVPKKGQMVFKTLTIAGPGEKQSKVGAECGNTSNLGEHHPRIRLFHAAMRSDATLSPKVLPDDDASWDAAGAKKRGEKPAHMLDLTHQPLCMYLEFLARIIDAQRVGGKRWYMNAPLAAASGLKGRA